MTEALGFAFFFFNRLMPRMLVLSPYLDGCDLVQLPWHYLRFDAFALNRIVAVSEPNAQRFSLV